MINTSRAVTKTKHFLRYLSESWFIALVFCLAFSLVVVTYITVSRDEKMALRRQGEQRAKETVNQIDLLYSNSVLRIQSYDEHFKLTHKSSLQKMSTLRQVLSYTIFKRISVFQLLDSIPEKKSFDRIKDKTPDFTNLDPDPVEYFDLPNLNRIVFLEGPDSGIQPPQSALMQSVDLRRGIGHMILNQQKYDTIIYNSDNRVLLSFIWKSTANSKLFYVFTTPLENLFQDTVFTASEYISISRSDESSKWFISKPKGKFEISELLPEQFNKDSNAEMIDIALSSSPKSVLNLNFHFVNRVHINKLQFSLLILIFGTIISVLLTYTFWILINQNRRVTDLVVQKTRELNHANHDLEEALAVKTRFLANVSHEIRTPLNLILGMIDLCFEIAHSAKQAEYLKSMKSAGSHLLAMVEDILEISKDSFHSIEIKTRKVDSIPFFEEICRYVGPLCRDKALDFFFIIDERVPGTLTLDPSRTRQVLLNLLRNSIKFTQHGYVKLHVSVSEIANDPKGNFILRFEVIDTGVGIPQQKTTEIFNRFFQVDSSKVLSEGGVGLGLSIVKELVEKMNGTVYVSSKVGVGSNFKVEIKMQESLDSVWSQPYRSKSVEPIRILLFSNDENISLCFEKILHNNFIHFSSFNSQNVKMGINSYLNGKALVLIDIEKTSLTLDEISIFDPSSIIYIGQKDWVKAYIKRDHFQLIERHQVLPNQVLVMVGLTSRLRERTEEVLPVAELEKLISKKENFSILIADDDAGNRTLFKAYLESMPFQLYFATNGQEVLDFINQNHVPDLIIADLRMPVMDGFTMIYELRNLERQRNIPQIKIILVTADALEETAEKAKALSVNAYMTKPVRKSNLLDAISRMN